MKRLVAFLSVLMMLTASALAEMPDLSQLSAQELAALIEQAQLELAQQEDKLIAKAIEQLKSYYKAEYEKYDDYAGEGYLEVIHTQVVYVKDEIDVDESCWKSAESTFGEVQSIVEFVVRDDWFYTAPYYYVTHGTISVVVAEDGTTKLLAQNLFNMYRGRTFSTDFSGIIESISDRGSEFNQSWKLMQ